MNAIELLVECNIDPAALAMRLRQAGGQVGAGAEIDTHEGRIVAVRGLSLGGIVIDTLAVGVIAARDTVAEQMRSETWACLAQAERLLEADRPAALVALVRATLWGCAPGGGPVRPGFTVDGARLAA